MSLLRTGVHALKWSVLGELGARVLGPLTFIVLARILVPADFGVVAAATVLVSLSQVVGDLGLTKALVQRSADIEDAAITAFWLSLGFGLLLMLLLWGLAGLVAAFFREPGITPLLRVLATTLPLAALSAVPMAVMQRELRFKPLFWARLAGAALPAAAALPVAWAGGGAWALVAGTLLGQVAQVAVLWRVSGWRPRWRFDAALAAELLRFGRWALLASLCLWGYGWLDAVVVGRWLNTHEMGLYRTGSTLVTMVFGLVFSPVLPVLYSLFSRAQHDLPLLREALMSVVRIGALVALPMALLLFALRDVLAVQVLGARWREAGLVIGLMALAHGASWLVTFNGELFRAVGRPTAEVGLLGPLLAVYVAVYVVVVQQGLEAFLWSRLALACLGIAVHVAFCWHVVQIAPRQWLRPLAALAAALGCAGLLLGVQHTGGDTGALLAAAVLLPLFTAALLRSEWPLVQRLLQRWRDAPPARALTASEV